MAMFNSYVSLPGVLDHVLNGFLHGYSTSMKQFTVGSIVPRQPWWDVLDLTGGPLRQSASFRIVLTWRSEEPHLALLKSVKSVVSLSPTKTKTSLKNKHALPSLVLRGHLCYRDPLQYHRAHTETGISGAGGISTSFKSKLSTWLCLKICYSTQKWEHQIHYFAANPKHTFLLVCTIQHIPAVRSYIYPRPWLTYVNQLVGRQSSVYCDEITKTGLSLYMFIPTGVYDDWYDCNYPPPN